jgi:hypothetical protein
MTNSTIASSTWTHVGAIAPSALGDARLELHHAAQIAVSAAISYVPARADDSHTALTWSTELGALTTEPITTPGGLRIALQIADLSLHAVRSGEVIRSLSLPGHSVDEAHAWLRDVAKEAGLEPERLTARKHYTIPSHPVASGAPFSGGKQGELSELARYWSNAAGYLEEFARATQGASSVRTWPHHFDIATLIELTGEPRRTVGVGQSPGDDSYSEPYWYVGPYPYPSTEALPPIEGGGHWHTTGWVGATLPAHGYIDASDQRAQVASFVESSVKACRQLLGG